MIQEFSIENTFSIKTRQTISFEAAENTDDTHCINVGGKKLLKLAAIYGANASGKSNVIKAFDFYMDFILNSFTSLKPQALIPFTPFLFDDENANAVGSFEIIFYIGETQYTYGIKLNASNIVFEELRQNTGNKEEILYKRSQKESFSYDYLWEFGAGADDVEQLNQIVKMTRANATFLSTAAQLNNDMLYRTYSYLEDSKLVLKDSFFDYTTGLLVNINYNNLQPQNIVDMLKKASIENIDDVVITYKYDKDYPDYEIFFSHKYEKSYKLPYKEESKGTRQIFELIGPLWDCINSEKNLFVDEIETSLHDDLLRFFISTFLKNTTKSQLLFTTHNQNLLDSEILTDDEIWFVQKNKDGGSELFSLIEFQDVPQNVSRMELYKAGAFGALPSTSTYIKE